MFTFNHFNFNVADLSKSLQFYRDALDLTPVGQRKEAAEGSFTIVYLGDGSTDFRLELTALRDHPQKYDLGECEFHLALRADDFEAAHKRHQEMGCICYENPGMGIYFIEDPDGLSKLSNKKPGAFALGSLYARISYASSTFILPDCNAQKFELWILASGFSYRSQRPFSNIANSLCNSH